jgi:hypothetical protein
MASNAEADAIAASLYQPTTDVKDEFFHQTPAQIFAHLLRKGPTPHQLAEWMANSETLETLVAGTEMSFYIDRKAGPQRAGVLPRGSHHTGLQATVDELEHAVHPGIF